MANNTLKNLPKSLLTLGALALVAIFVWTTYNSLVNKEENLETAWSDVENQYQRKNDVIGNIAKTAKKYSEFEQETLTSVVEARAKATQMNVELDASNLTPAKLKQFQAAQQEMNAGLGRLLATFEKYPDLKSDQLYINLQRSLEGSENRIAEARRGFNESAKQFNKKTRRFPSNFVANIFGFDKKPYFEADADAKENDYDVGEDL